MTYKKLGKKASNWFEDWPEYMFLILLVIGFVLGMSSSTPFLGYSVIFLLGLISGRMLYQRRFKKKFPIVVSLLGLIFGFLIGSFKANWKLMIVIFIIGNILSHYVHRMGHFKEQV